MFNLFKKAKSLDIDAAARQERINRIKENARLEEERVQALRAKRKEESAKLDAQYEQDLKEIKELITKRKAIVKRFNEVVDGL